jgi:Undecaprenyl-phosphate glucose phosphotransferase
MEQAHGRLEAEALTEAAWRVARTLRRPALAPGALALVAAGLDAAAVGLGLWFAEFAAAGAAMAAGRAAIWAAASAAAAVLILSAARCYAPGSLRRFRRGWAQIAAAAALVAAAGYGLGGWTGLGVLLGPALAAAPGRALAAAAAGWAIDGGLIERRAVVIGGGAEAARLIRGLAANADNDIRVCGIFDDRDDKRSPPAVIGTPKLGTVRELVAFARAAEIDMLIVALPLAAQRRIRDILEVVRVLPADVRLSTYSDDFAFPRRGDARLIAVIRHPLADGRWMAKRALDLAGASAALLLLAPAMLAVAAAIRFESRGPALFRQPRHGYNHRPIEVWKFRSMFLEHCDGRARRIVTRDDPRVTRVGRFIRRWSLDELPQLFNVLRGDLSLVGPRPHAVAAVSSRQQAFEEIVGNYAARHRVPPGVTGWAQVNGWRGEIDDPAKLEARVSHDLYYIENWSIWFDLRILAMTPLKILAPHGAY